MSSRWEYATQDWDQDYLRCNLPEGRELREQGSYDEVVAMLTRLGYEGWEAATRVASGN